MDDTRSFRRDGRTAVTADIQLRATPDHFVDAVLVDISRYGLATDGLQHFGPDLLLDVVFPDGSTRKAWAVWNDDFQDGFAFDLPMEDQEFALLVSSLKYHAKR